MTGAVASITSSGIILHDTPTTKIKKGKTIKTDYLPVEMVNLLYPYHALNTHVFLESVHAMPGQGSTSMFRFGEGYGLWIGIISALLLPMTKVTPQAWKKMLMAGIGDKDAARQRAQELFPDCAGQLSRKLDIGRADALLIAEFGRRTLK